MLPLASIPILLLFVLPLWAVLTGTTLAGLLSQLVDNDTATAVRLSLATTAISTSLSLLLGIPLAYLLARGDLPGRKVIDLIVDLPLVLPPLVAGLGLLLVFGENGLASPILHMLGIHVVFTRVAVVLAQMFVAAPLLIRSAATGFGQVDVALEEAAQIDGANFLQRFFFVTLPLSARSVLAGTILCWTRGLGEFGATILFAGNLVGRTQTMPLAIYVGFELDVSRAITLSAILLCVSLTVLAVLRLGVRRRIGEAHSEEGLGGVWMA